MGSVALLALLAAAAYFVQRRRRATAKDAGLPTVAPAARGGNVASAPGPGTEDKDSAFAWQERTLLPVRRLCVLSCQCVVPCVAARQRPATDLELQHLVHSGMALRLSWYVPCCSGIK